MSLDVKVSIVLPTRNGMPRFATVLDRILAQRCDWPFELYCVDTESTDGTWEEIERRRIRRRRIRKSEFDHGRTRAEAIAETDGELVVLTVQDATPKDERWLQELVLAVRSREDAACAYSRQVPYDDVSPFLAARLERWAAGRDEPRVQKLPPGRTLESLPPLERLDLCALDDVSSIVRRDVWEELGVSGRRFGEDVAFGKAVIEAGYAIVYAPRSTVVHSHDHGALAEFQRIYRDHQNLYDLFGLLTVPTLRDAIRNTRAQYAVYREMVEGMRAPAADRARMLRFARRLAAAETFGQWLGARSVRKGPPRGLFRWIDRFAGG